MREEISALTRQVVKDTVDGTLRQLVQERLPDIVRNVLKEDGAVVELFEEWVDENDPLEEAYGKADSYVDDRFEEAKYELLDVRDECIQAIAEAERDASDRLANDFYRYEREDQAEMEAWDAAKAAEAEEAEETAPPAQAEPEPLLAPLRQTTSSDSGDELRFRRRRRSAPNASAGTAGHLARPHLPTAPKTTPCVQARVSSSPEARISSSPPVRISSSPPARVSSSHRVRVSSPPKPLKETSRMETSLPSTTQNPQSGASRHEEAAEASSSTRSPSNQSATSFVLPPNRWSQWPSPESGGLEAGILCDGQDGDVTTEADTEALTPRDGQDGDATIEADAESSWSTPRRLHEAQLEAWAAAAQQEEQQRLHQTVVDSDNAALSATEPDTETSMSGDQV